MEGKRALLRVVRTPEGLVALDPTGKRNGRGAYVHREPACFDRAVAGRLWRALRMERDEAETALDALREAFRQVLATPAVREPMVHRAPVPLPEHLIARGRRGPARTPRRQVDPARRSALSEGAEGPVDGG